MCVHVDVVCVRGVKDMKVVFYYMVFDLYILFTLRLFEMLLIKDMTTPPEEPDGQEQNYEICSDSLSLPCDHVQPPISSTDPDPVPIDSVSTPSELEVSTVTCEKCQTYAERFAQLQDSCRKGKQRRGALQMEVNQLKKINKDLRKVKIIYSRLSELRLLRFHRGGLSINVFVLL